MRSHIYCLFVLVTSALSATAQTCYYPNGETANGLVPCNPSANVTACCKDSDLCLTNGFCFSPGLNSIVRRACTDKTFNSTDCPRTCLKDELGAGDVVMTPCGQYSFFCCGQDGNARNCCDSGNHTNIGTSEVINVNLTEPVRTVTFTSTLAFSPTPTSSSPPSNTSPPGPCTQSKNIIIPLGVLLGCAALALTALGFDWKYKRNELRRHGIRDRKVMKQSAAL